MIEVIGVKFRKAGKTYYFDPSGLKISIDEKVIVETSSGIEIGECAEENQQVDDSKVVQPLRKVLRAANEEDFKTVEKNKAIEAKALETCQQKADEHKLDMKVVDVEYAFDGSKILFYFTADGRIDFRELVKELAGIFRVRIELRQIGVRDEAKMLGGLGICGRPFCCSTYLQEFHPVSIKMAKEQNLSLNPTKISGTCGRLMCCLKYEQDAYVYLSKIVPRAGSFVKTPDGEGTIIEVAFFKQQVKVLLTGQEETTAKYYPASEVKVLRSGRPKAKKVDGSGDNDISSIID
jgi:cell fate regulator YaaT (PSP1 superfamily)